MNKLLEYLPFHFLIGLIIGIYLQFNFQFLLLNYYKALFSGGIILIALYGCLLLKKRVAFSFLSFSIFILIGMSIVYIHDHRNYKNHYTNHYLINNSAVFYISKVLKSNKYYYQYEASVLQINQTKTIGNILFKVKKDSATSLLKAGQSFLLYPLLKKIPPPLNPYQFNYKKYLAKRNIQHQVISSYKELKPVKNYSFSLISFASSIRYKIQHSLKKASFSPNGYALINALLLGERKNLSNELLENYAKAGAIHILAISGLHIGIILLLLSQLLKPLEYLSNGRILKSFLIVTILWAFAFITGLSPSVARAVTMFSFIAIGNSFQKTLPIEYSLVSSMLFLLLIQPTFLFEIGFQLSYLAVFGIIWIQPLLYRLWNPSNSFLNKIWQLATVSIAAQTAVLPISLYYFHQFPSLFLLSNIVIIPFLGIILTCGFLIILLSMLEILPQYIISGYDCILQSMNQFIYYISIQEAFIFSNITISFSCMLLCYLLLFFTILFITQKKIYFFQLFLISFILLQILLFIEKYKQIRQQGFIVFHKNKNAIVGIKRNGITRIYHHISTSKTDLQQTITPYLLNEGSIATYIPYIPTILQYKNQNILMIDRLGIYPLKKLHKPIVVLQYSPKINLNRLIEQLQPIKIIADGTNYKNDIKLWESSCKKKKTPFHYTGENGAFILN
ncbi:Probable transmembrane hypothetical protein [Tenacibaculum maritimum]|uniref:ComEC/Rec2 family competence protein n=1 Tax=Tenacibaculum maritimum TaxID=107401 RepID=UPI0012E436DE|nr:ComEC/Rec2 family competence protein [Tenacibaculum maritimum]CAA0190540.1 Probable transmembrane hypothetical protein [Tenacibaculum maritimum]